MLGGPMIFKFTTIYKKQINRLNEMKDEILAWMSECRANSFVCYL